MCVMGILMALIERQKSGKGQVIDANLVSCPSFPGALVNYIAHSVTT